MNYRSPSRLDDVLGVAAIVVAVVAIVTFDITVTHGDGLGRAEPIAAARSAPAAEEALRMAAAPELAQPIQLAAATHH